MRKAALLTLSLAALSAAVSGCGFKPIYAETGAVAPILSNVAVETGDDRVGYLMRKELTDRFGFAGADPAYRLTVSTSERRDMFGIRLDRVATRFEIVVTAQYVMRDMATNVVITSGSALGAASYDVSNEPYADIATETSARERAAALAAERMEKEIAFYLSSVDDGSS